MCEQCSAAVDIWPIPLEGWLLIRATRTGLSMEEGDWGLVECNDPDFIWSLTPTPEPPSAPEDARFDDPAVIEFYRWYNPIEAEFFGAMEGEAVAGGELVQTAI